MAAPTVSATLAAQGSVTTLTPTLATHVSGNLLFLVCFSAAQAVSLTTANGWVALTAANGVTANASGADSAACYVFYKVAASASETAPLIADPGNHLGVISLTVTGADTDPSRFVVSADVESAAGATAVTMPSVTTVTADNLIMLICNTGHDQTGGSLAALTNVTISPAIAECSGVTDGGGSVGNIFAGTMASAGATGTSTGTLSVGSRQARAVIAIPPPAAAFNPAWAAGCNQGLA